jgi:hypothetical protein
VPDVQEVLEVPEASEASEVSEVSEASEVPGVQEALVVPEEPDVQGKVAQAKGTEITSITAATATLTSTSITTGAVAAGTAGEITHWQPVSPSARRRLGLLLQLMDRPIMRSRPHVLLTLIGATLTTRAAAPITNRSMRATRWCTCLFQIRIR